MSWDPDRYRRFAAERAEPFDDLVGLIEPGASRIWRAVDLGCGSGELTVELARRLDIDEVVGIDRSPEMVAAAHAHAARRVTFSIGDIASWAAVDTYDLVFSNAALHWVPDHERVLVTWSGALRTGGQLAVQMPANSDHPSHRIIDEVAQTEPFLSAMGGSPPADPVSANVLAPERYAEVLHDLGFSRQHVRLQVYSHLLDRSADVVEWTRGATLTRVVARLPSELVEPFVERYRAEFLRRVGDRSPYHYTFKRLLLWARR